MAHFLSTALLLVATLALLDEGFMVAFGGGIALSGCALLVASLLLLRRGDRGSWGGLGVAAGGFLLGTVVPLPGIPWLALLLYTGLVRRGFATATALAAALVFLLSESRSLGALADVHVELFGMPLAVSHFLPVTAVYLGLCVASARGSRLLGLFAAVAVILPVVIVQASHQGHGLLPQLTLVQDLVRVASALLVAAVAREHAGQPDAARTGWLALLTAGVCAGLALLPGWWPSRLPASVLILDEGGVDWDVPTKREYGPFSIGMFGLLPEYLEAAGLRVRRERLTAGELLQSDRLADFDYLICINNARRWTPAEVATVEHWVDDGGLLLVLCDHTDVFGLAEATNRLLGGMGARVRFDSAYPMQSSWRGCLKVSSAAQRIWGLPMLAAGGSWGIGCSFDLSARWKVLIGGHRCFSDAGSYANVSGSFLGNYAWDHGEAVGGLPLVAGRSFGRGHVVVFGDTGWFQNGTTVGVFERCIAPCFGSAVRASVDCRLWREVLHLVALISLLWLASRRRSPAFVAVGLWTAATALGVAGPADMPRLPVDSETFVEIIGLPRDIGHYHLHYNSIASVRITAARAGRRVLKLPLDDPRIDAAGVLALVAPARELTADEHARLCDYVRRGGHLLVVASGLEASHCGQLLAEAGFEGGIRIADARGTVNERESDPRFIVPGAIVDHPDLVRHATVGGRLVAASSRLDAGWMHWICDSRFLSDVNTDGPGGVVPANLYLLDQIVVRDKFVTLSNGGGSK